MKKVLSLVLVIALVLSSMVTAFAAAPTDIAENDYKTAIETLVAFGVLNGYPDGTFKPEKEIKRAEMAKILVEALGYGDHAVGATSSFSDTQNHWASGYIAIATNINLTNGYPDGTFKPEQTVRYNEALAMVVRALGYTDAVVKGTWPTNYVVKATDLDLIKNVKMAEFADRGGVAQIFYNALEAYLVEVSSDNIAERIPTSRRDSDNNIIYKALIDQIGKIKEIEVDADTKNSVIDLTPYMYQDLTVYTNKAGDVVYVKSVDTLTVEAKVEVANNGVVEIKDYEFGVTSNAAIMLNGGQINYKDNAVVLEDETVTLVLNAKSDAKLSNSLNVKGVVAKIATEYTQVDEEYDKDELVLNGFKLPVKDKKVDYSKLTVTGDASELEDIKENDVLSLFYGKGEEAADVKLEVIVSRETVKGKVTRIDSDGDVYIDGTSYEVNSAGDNIEVADEGIFYLDHEGKIFAVDTENTSAPVDYALVLNMGEMVKAGSRTIAKPEIKLLTASGEEITYVLKESQHSDSEIGFGFGSVGANGVVPFTGNVAIGDLVKYNVNSSKEVDNVIEVAKGNHSNAINTKSNSFNLASNAVIFNVPNDVTANAEVVTVSDLNDEIKGYRIYDGNKIVVVIATDGVAGEDGIFAIITNADGTAYDEDEDKAVKLFVTYVDGKKVEYLAGGYTTAGPLNQVVELVLKGGKLENVITTSVTGSGIKQAANSRVTISISEVDNAGEVIGSPYYLSDDVVVYVMKENSSGQWVFDTVGSKNDIRNNEFQVFDTDNDLNEYEIVFVYK